MADHCIQFDGVEDYVVIGAAADWKWLHGAADTANFKWTIEFWMKMPDAEPDTVTAIIATSNNGSTADTGITLHYDDRSAQGRSRQFGLLVTRGVNGQPVCSFQTADDVYPDDTDWHYIHLTYDQSLANTNAKIYVDNVAKGTGNKEVHTPTTDDPNGALHLGVWTGYLTSYEFVGHLEELRISDIVRSTAERTAAYNSGSGQELTVDGNTIALWHMNEGALNTMGDETTSHDGTLVGASWDTGITFPAAGGWAHNFLGIPNASIGKVCGIPIASIGKIDGV